MNYFKNLHQSVKCYKSILRSSRTKSDVEAFINAIYQEHSNLLHIKFVDKNFSI